MQNPNTSPLSTTPGNTPQKYPNAYPAGLAYPSTPGNAPEDTSILGEFTFARLVHIFKRKWYIILLFAGVAAGAGQYVVRTSEKVYQTKSSFEVLLRRPRMVSQEGLINASASYTEGFKTFVLRIQSSERLKQEALRVLQEDPVYATQDVNRLHSLASVQFNPVRSSYVIEVYVAHPQATVTSDLANAYVEAISRITIEDNRNSADYAVRALDKQKNATVDELTKIEDKLSSVRQASDLAALESRKANLDTSITSITSELLSLESTITVQREAMSLLKSKAPTIETLDATPESVLSSVGIGQTLNDLKAAETERRKLLIRYTPKHPDVLEQDVLIKALRSDLEKAMEAAETSLASKLQLLERRQQTLLAKKDAYTADRDKIAFEIQQVNTRISRDEREKEAIESSYNGILKRIEEARLAADENSAVIKPLVRAKEPGRPIKPDPSSIMRTALGTGILLGILVALIADKMEDFIWTATDIEKGLGLRIIGLLPHMRIKKRESLAMYSEDHPTSIFAESFAGIRNTLMSGPNRENNRSILITSSNPQEGKTISSVNLAINYAHAGKRTLLVDLDMRIPRLYKVFGVEPTEDNNLIQALSGRDSSVYGKLPQETHIPHLSLVISSPLQHVKPPQILGSQAMQDFLEWARANYEQVILDSPPFGLVSDSTLLATLADGVIIVARERKSRKAVLRRALMNFYECGANVLGVIVNDIQSKDRKYSYYSPYSHHHTYYYGGYGSTKKK